MYADVSKPPPPLPQPQLQNVSSGLRLLPPLTRSQQAGPGVIILVPDGLPSVQIEKGVPSSSLKWAEEGYAVAEVQASYFEEEGQSSLKRAVDALKDCAECSSTERIGLIGMFSEFPFS
jgi:carboxymethylenebutenolidase